MKNIFTPLLAALLLLGTLAAQAQTIRRVNNTGVAVSGVNVYSTLQAAHDAASSGDIIYLEPSNISYGDLTCVRPLTIIGNGYFLAQNPGLQLDLRESQVGTIYFNNGSAGSRITGCDINGTIYITASNVTVERNNVGAQIFAGYSNIAGYNTISGIIFRQNYVTSTFYLYPTSTTNVSNVNITNNIFATGSITASSSYYNRISNILISNNVIGSITSPGSQYTLEVDNAVIKNNILIYNGTGTSFTPRNNAYSYNIAGNSAFGTANGNQQNVTAASLFVGGTASADGAYQLRSGSPAIGTGESGVDVGAFGGAVPYRLSGIPNVPTIYQYNQSVSGNSLNATISTRSNN